MLCPNGGRLSLIIYTLDTPRRLFSSTDVSPMTSRAKLLMMLESAISLVTTVAVAARAINILGS
jgi:hypothetical protein